MKLPELHAKRNQLTGSNPDERFGLFKLFMIYATGAAVLRVTQTYTGTPSEHYFIAALHFNSAAEQKHLIHSIEAMTLLVLYSLRSSSSSGVWYMIDLALRSCVDIGLHRDAHYRNLRPYEAQLRRRLFWSFYLLERNVAWSLGRPFSLSEQDIDVELPYDIDDSLKDGESVPRNVAGASRSPEKHVPSNLTAFIASLKLKRIESQVQSSIYRVDKTVLQLLPGVPPLLSLLEEYETSLPTISPAADDFLRMHWNNATRLLLQPFLGIISPDDRLIGICMHASGQVCQLFKKMRQRDAFAYSFQMVNSIFMAGLTMCYCLFRSPVLRCTSVANDLRACSSALFVMAERSSGLKKYRDILETIICSAMDFVTEKSSLSLQSVINPNNAQYNQQHSSYIETTSCQQDFELLQAPLGSIGVDPIEIHGEAQLERPRLFSTYDALEAETQQFRDVEPQWNFLEYPQMVDGVDLDVLWDGDKFGLKMINELLMPLSSEGLRRDNSE